MKNIFLELVNKHEDRIYIVAGKTKSNKLVKATSWNYDKIVEFVKDLDKLITFAVYEKLPDENNKFILFQEGSYGNSRLFRTDKIKTFADYIFNNKCCVHIEGLNNYKIIDGVLHKLKDKVDLEFNNNAVKLDSLLKFLKSLIRSASPDNDAKKALSEIEEKLLKTDENMRDYLDIVKKNYELKGKQKAFKELYDLLKTFTYKPLR
jgi:hypothetical protein